LKNPHNYETTPIELFVDVKNLKKTIEDGHKILLKFLVFLNVYLLINLEDGNVHLG
jgi:hypothetical protein